MVTPAVAQPTSTEIAHPSAGARSRWIRWLEIGVVVAGVVAAGIYAERRIVAERAPVVVATANGRIEAVEIDIAAKTPGRVKEILVDEGDFVEPGQVLARMDTTQLEAQKRQAEAQLERAKVSVQMTRSLLTERQAERAQAAAVVEQRAALATSARRRLERTEQLVRSGSLPEQKLDDDHGDADSAEAALTAARAQAIAADAALATTKVQVSDTEAAVDAARATVDSIKVEIDDSTLVAPRAGRVQLRIVQPGEVLGAGSRVLDVIDLEDVYMTFFLPTEQAGRVALGSDVRIVLDAANDVVVPAKVSFVADVAQFTPKTVETEKERQKLMFRVKARIAPALLRRHLEQVKIGLPGVANVRLDPNAPWPAALDKPVLE